LAGLGNWPRQKIRRICLLTSRSPSGIKGVAAVAATRGDLGQLAPRKKLLKSWQSFLETLRALWHGGFFHFALLAARINSPSRVSFRSSRGLSRKPVSACESSVALRRRVPITECCKLRNRSHVSRLALSVALPRMRQNLGERAPFFLRRLFFAA